MRLIAALFICAAPLSAANLYHPGDFETHLVGGCYSSDTAVTLSPAANSTRGGRHCWALAPSTYQHLELLVPGHARYRLSLKARAEHPFTLELKVVTPGTASPTTADTKIPPQEILHRIPIPATAGSTFAPITYEFETVAPYPGPIQTEILLGGYNAGPAPIFLDDLSLETLTPSPLLPLLGAPLATALRNADFSSGLDHWTLVSAPAAPAHHAADLQALVLGELANPAAPATEVAQTFPAADLAGRAVMLSAEVRYLTTDQPLRPWAAILLILEDPDAPAATQVLPSIPAPLWLPLGQAAPPGRPRVISGVFTLPVELRRLRLRLLAQPGLGANLAAVDNLTLHAVPNPPPPSADAGIVRPEVETRRLSSAH